MLQRRIRACYHPHKSTAKLMWFLLSIIVRQRSQTQRFRLAYPTLHLQTTDFGFPRTDCLSNDSNNNPPSLQVIPSHSRTICLDLYIDTEASTRILVYAGAPSVHFAADLNFLTTRQPKTSTVNVSKYNPTLTMPSQMANAKSSQMQELALQNRGSPAFHYNPSLHIQRCSQCTTPSSATPKSTGDGTRQ